jgi:hypothetical protein
MDTRIKIIFLVDYKEYYGIEKTIEDANNLIKNIPSSTLINYISGFNIHLYLNEQDSKIQQELIYSLFNRMENRAIEQLQNRTQELFSQHKMNIIYFWNYSNYLFYDLIFKNYNDLPCRDLTSQEAQSFFDAYLILNGIANELINPATPDFADDKNKNNMERLIITNFIQQRDFVSNLDFRNQITRCLGLFEYIENHSNYSKFIKGYYNHKQTSGYLDLLKTISWLIVATDFTQSNNARKQIITITQDGIKIGINRSIIQSLCINNDIGTYDNKKIWTKPLFKISKDKYYVLDINFLINQLYKSQIFEFNSYLKNNNVKSDFLSDKGKEFSEEIYLRDIIKTCFPDYIKFFGTDCINNKNEELCDVYLRDNDKICLIEFKDTLFNDSIKQNRKVSQTLDELDKKFFTNQKGKPKGVTQLANAVKDINSNGIKFDPDIPKQIKIFPIVLYTDNAFGMDGINYLYIPKFKNQITNQNCDIDIFDVTFINLSYLEMHEEVFTNKSIDIFNIIGEYHKHIKEDKYKYTPFEIFSRFYMNKIKAPDMPQSKRFQKATEKILNIKN